MADRITSRHLEGLCRYINKLLGVPLEPYAAERNAAGELVPNEGNHHMSGAYGGWCIYRMAASGGVSTPIWDGFIPARQAYAQMQAYIRGLEARQDKGAA